MPLPPTPWLNPPDYTGAFLHGAQIGASAGEANARIGASMAEANARLQASMQMQSAQLAQQEQLAQMQAQIRTKIADQRAKEHQQRIAIDAAYKESEIGLQRERLKQANDAFMAKTQQAAKLAANRALISSLIQQGEDPNDVYMKHGAEAGYTPSQMDPIFKSMAPIPEEIFHKANRETGEPDRYVNPKTGAIRFVPTPTLDPYVETQREVLRERLKELNKNYDEATRDKVKKGFQKQIDETNERLRRLVSPNFPTENPGLPLPESPEKLEVGKVYQTSRGLATWDGKMFIPE